MTLRVKPGPLLRDRTTLKLGGRAAAEIAAERPEDLDGLSPALAKAGGAPLVLGAGSNILARDGDLPLTVVSLDFASGPEVVPGAAEGHVRVRAGAAVKLGRLLAFCEKRGLWGLHGLAGIPGELGGAVAMNAGSYGCEMAKTLARAHIWTPEDGLSWIGREDWSAGYRTFSPKGVEGLFLVVEAEMDFPERGAEAVRAAALEALGKKKATQPLSAASAGCVFKNPAGESAGRLLDQAGFKGKRLGDMAFSEMHANFLVNLGAGRADDALALMDEAVSAVRERFGVSLELEVRVTP
jgi:UDP-N-acetylmuramate dehydrogenase